MNLRALTLSSALLLATYISEGEAQSVDAADNGAARPTGSPSLQQGSLTIPGDIFSALPEKNATRTALFCDLHVHTTYSLDAFNVGTMATPHDA